VASDNRDSQSGADYLCTATERASGAWDCYQNDPGARTRGELVVAWDAVLQPQLAGQLAPLMRARVLFNLARALREERTQGLPGAARPGHSARPDHPGRPLCRATLTLSALLALRDAGRPLPAAAAALSPVTGFSLSGASLTVHDGRDIICWAELRQVRSAYLVRTACETVKATYLASAGPAANSLVRAANEVVWDVGPGGQGLWKVSPGTGRRVS